MSFSSFFSKLQEADWYRQFLNPVVDAIEADSYFLDIGTGSGKLLEILSTEKNVTCTGVDTDSSMLEEARIKLKNVSTQLIKIEPNEALPFQNNSFDNVAICNVLFHLEKEAVFDLLGETRRLLKKGGKILVLTPTGKGGVFKLARHFLSWSNRSVFIWHSATQKRAITWGKNKYLAEYCKSNGLKYQSAIALEGFSLVETIVV